MSLNPPTSKTPLHGQEIAPEYFRAIAEGTVDWESWMSSDGELLWVNEAVERFTGFTPAECLAMDDYPCALIAKEDRSRMSEHLRDAASGSSENNIEFRVQHRDGSEAWMAISWQPLHDATGRSLGYRASVRDISEKHKMREQLRLQNEHLEQLVQERTARIAELEKHRLKMEKLAAIGELAAGVAHEINNPLAGIRNAFTLIRRHFPKNGKHYDKLELIDREIERISGITHQMYQLYRPSGQDVTQFSVTRLVDEVITLAQPLSQKSRVGVLLNVERLEQAGSLAGDEVCLRAGELKQVLLNLVRNAIQASSSEQNVVVSVLNETHQLTIKVTDHGHGISASVIKNVFDPFFSTKTETIGQGMGLGLSVSLGIVEAMQGTIEVNSEPGIETEFIVRFPRGVTTEDAAGSSE